MAPRRRPGSPGQLSFFGEVEAVVPPPPRRETPPAPAPDIPSPPPAPVEVVESPPPREEKPAPVRRRRSRPRAIERIQTGVRLEARLLKVLKGLAEAKGTTLGQLVEQLALHAMAGTVALSTDETERIAHLRQAFRLPEESFSGGAVQRAQAGILVEARLLKVLKATALLLDCDLAELLEEIALSAFAARPCFPDGARHKITQLARLYEMSLSLSSFQSPA